MTAPENAETIERLQRKLQRLTDNQQALDDRLRRVEDSVVFRTLRAIGGTAQISKRKLGHLLLRSPLHPMIARFAKRKPARNAYAEWLAQEQPAPLAPSDHGPLISVLIPIYRPERRWLEAAIASVRAQSYGNWQLCLCADGGSAEWVAGYLEQLGRSDRRIRTFYSNERLGISGALNSAGRISSGEYISFLDHDDTLAPDALAAVAAAIQSTGGDLFYSDEDHLNEAGEREQPRFKPAWSPELLLRCMYLSHVLVVSRRKLDELGWFRSEFDGAQDFDLALRVADKPLRVTHIPRVLYHWRKHTGSTAASAGAKPYAQEACRRALEDTVQRRGMDARVAEGPRPFTFQVLHKSRGSASVIVPSRNARLLRRCLRSIRPAVDGTNSEVIVVLHRAPGTDEAALTRVISEYGCQQVDFTGEFNFAAMNNLAANRASKDAIVFLNDDITALSDGWLAALLGQVERPDAGIAGALLLYPSGAIQHAGIAVGTMDGAGHMGRGLFRSDLWEWLNLTREVTAVTGACMAIRKNVFAELGGFDAIFPSNYNDVDLCLRARERGYRVVLEAGAALRHDESRTRKAGTAFTEREEFHDRWGKVLANPDPFYSPFLSRDREEIALRLPFPQPACLIPRESPPARPD